MFKLHNKSVVKRHLMLKGNQKLQNNLIIIYNNFKIPSYIQFLKQNIEQLNTLQNQQQSFDVVKVKRTVKSEPDLDPMFREKRQRRAEIRKILPKQITNYFTIKHIDTPIFGSLKYHPKYKLITGFSGQNSLIWKLIDDQVYENNRVNDQLALKKMFLREVSIIESTNSIVKQDNLNIKIFDYKTLQQKCTLVLSRVKYGYIQLTENVHLNQIIFLNERKCFIIVKLKEYKTIRTIFDSQAERFVDQQKSLMLFTGNKLKMYFNSKNKTKLVKHYYLNEVSFSGRIFSTSKHQNNLSTTKLVDICTMKMKSCLYKKGRCLQSLFVNELGIFIVLYKKSLDIFDSNSFQLLGNEQLLDNNLNKKNTFQMAFDSSQLLIFYKSNREFKSLQQINYLEV